MRTSEPLAAATDLPSDARSAPAARAFVREVLSGSRVESVLDAAELCVSELVTNALLHAGTRMRLEIAPAGSGVRIGVHDGSDAVPTLARHTSTASTGRGLAMMVAVADAWGVEPDGQGGKTVWCELTERRADVPDLDIDAVLDAWELSSEHQPDDDPDPGPDDPTKSGVVLRRFPVRLGQRLQEHYEAVLRECQLLAAPRPDALPGVPERLLELARVLAERYSAELSELGRPDPRRLAAHAHGHDVVDLRYLVDPEQIERLTEWERLLDDVDQFSRRGDLLVPTIPHSLALLRGWALTEFLRQNDGASPTEWTGAVE